MIAIPINPVLDGVGDVDAQRVAYLKGRIAGLREAAEIADRFDWSAGELIRAAADKLEKGEA